MTFSAQGILAWASRNERKLGAVVFVSGFLTDIVTFGLFPLTATSYFYIAYLSVTLLALFVTHLLYSRAWSPTTVFRTARVVFPLIFQFCMGSLLSGTLIFYTRSGSVFVSWPFLLVFLLVFVGNEYFRMYKDRLVFQTLLFYLTFYAYLLFAYPFYTHVLTSWSFYISTAIAAGGMSAILAGLFFIGKSRFLQSFEYIIATCVGATLIMVGSYTTGILPPLPLSLRDAGIYHGLVKSGGDYILYGEPSPWYTNLLGETVHVAQGETLYAYSSVFAPAAFSATLSHLWEYYDSEQKKWVTVSKVSFPISGGRDGGYRGYSQTTSITPGKWRVSVLSGSGQVIGRLSFTVVQAATSTALIEERK